MRPRRRHIAPVVLAVATLTGAGCASMTTAAARVDRSLEYASNAISWASWDHLKFSAAMLGRDPALATPDEAAVARRQGGWWGDEVPVASR